MKIDPNAPAFPVESTSHKEFGLSGVPIRLWLAAQAMQGYLSNEDFTQQLLRAIGEKEDGAIQRSKFEKIICTRACRLADALIAEYNRTPEPPKEQQG